MNKEQWEIIREGVLQFNRLVTTPEERKTEAYILKCYDLLEDEDEELYSANTPIDYLDGLCDVVVTSLQTVDALTPSQLEWDYISEQIEIGGSGKRRDFDVEYIVSSIERSQTKGYDLFGAMMEVNRSNLSKAPPVSQVKYLYGDNLDEAMKAASEWIEDKYLDNEGNQRYAGVHGKVVVDSEGAKRVVFRDKNLKVVKWVGFSEPNLEPYLGVK